jgi:hypothetical protein
LYTSTLMKKGNYSWRLQGKGYIYYKRNEASTRDYAMHTLSVVQRGERIYVHSPDLPATFVQMRLKLKIYTTHKKRNGTEMIYISLNAAC